MQDSKLTIQDANIEFAFLNTALPLSDLSPPREELAQGKPHHSPAVPGLFQFFRKLGGNLIKGGEMLILKLYRHLNKAVFMLFVLCVPVPAVFVMRVGMIM